MLPPSDNFFAETLVKDLGARFGGAGTTAAGAAVVGQTIASLLGIHPHVVDGSGLVRADRTSVYEVADLLVGVQPTPLGALLRGSMAVAGRSGTLESACAARAPRALPGQDRHADRLLEPRRLLPGGQRPPARVRVLQRRDLDRTRARGPGPHDDHAGGLLTEQLAQGGFTNRLALRRRSPRPAAPRPR